MTLGEILDRTAQIYRRNFWTFAGISAVPVVAMFAIVIPIALAFAAFKVNLQQGSWTDSVPFVVTLAIMGLIAIPVLMAASVAEQTALTRAAIAAHMGSKLTVREAIKSVWPRFWRYLWLLVLQGLLVGGIPMAAAVAFLIASEAILGTTTGSSAAFGFVVFLVFAAVFVYAIWRLLCYSMAMPACLVEEKTGWQSIKRANLLSKGTRWRMLAMYLLVLAIIMAVSMIVDIGVLIVIGIVTAIGHSKFGTAVMAAGQILYFLSNFALQTLITPVSMIALVLFYYDQRVRKEGYDIELMMEQAGLHAPPAAPTAPTTTEVEKPATPPVESPLVPSFEPEASPDTVKES
jgi:hypothetical protein